MTYLYDWYAEDEDTICGMTPKGLRRTHPHDVEFKKSYFTYMDEGEKILCSISEFSSTRYLNDFFEKNGSACRVDPRETYVFLGETKEKRETREKIVTLLEDGATIEQIADATGKEESYIKDVRDGFEFVNLKV